MNLTWTSTTINLDLVDLPATVDETKVRAIMASVEAGKAITAVSLWLKPSGRFEVLDEPEKIVASLRLGYEFANAYVVRCPPQMKRLLAIKLHLQVKRLRPIPDGSHRHGER